MHSQAPAKHEGVEIKAVNIAEHISNASAPLPDGAMEREFAVNAQQAGASEVHFGIDPIGSEQGVFQRIVVDDGEGMDAETLRCMADLGYSRSRDRGDRHNRGTGAKNASLMANPMGLTYFTRRDGKTLMMMLQQTISGDSYIIRSFRTSENPEQPDEIVIDIDSLDDDGTLYTLDGEVFIQNYTKVIDGKEVEYEIDRDWRRTAYAALGDRESGTAVLLLGSQDNPDTFTPGKSLDKFRLQKLLSSRFFSITSRDGGDFSIYCTVVKSYNQAEIELEKERREIRPIGTWLERPHFSVSGKSSQSFVRGLTSNVANGASCDAITYLVPASDLKDGVNEENPTGAGFDHATFPFFGVAHSFHKGIVEVIHVESPGAINGHPAEGLQRILPSSPSIRSRLAVVLFPQDTETWKIVADNEARTKVVAQVNGSSRELPIAEFCYALKSRLPDDIRAEVSAGVRITDEYKNSHHDVLLYDSIFPGNMYADVIIMDEKGRISAAKKDGTYVTVDNPKKPRKRRSGGGGSSGGHKGTDLHPGGERVEVGIPLKGEEGRAKAAVARAGLPKVILNEDAESPVSCDYTAPATKDDIAEVTVYLNSPVLKSFWDAIDNMNMDPGKQNASRYSSKEDPARVSYYEDFKRTLSSVASGGVAGLVRMIEDAEIARRSVSSSNPFHETENIDGLRMMLNDSYLLGSYIFGNRSLITRHYQRAVGRMKSKQKVEAE